MDEVKYIKPKEVHFFRSSGGFLGMRIDEAEYSRVSLHKAFPFSHSNKYISVRDKEGKEVGIIEDLQEFSNEIIELYKEELERRYLLPKVEKIISIKEEFGYSYWDVITNLGDRRFTTKKDNSSFANVKEHRILVIDVDGNRYEIADYTRLDSKSYKLIELLL